MDRSKNGIALSKRTHYHPQAHEIPDLSKILALLLHLPVYAVEVFRTPLDLGRDAYLVKSSLKRLAGLLDVAFPLLPLRGDPLHQLIVGYRIEIPEGKILQLPFHSPHAKPVCKGRIYLQCLSGHAFLFFRRRVVQSPHVVKPVRQFDQNDPDVLGHGHKHLSQALSLLFLPALKVHPRQFRYPVHKCCNFGAKSLADLPVALACILNDVMEKACSYCIRIQVHVGKDECHSYRMVEVRLPRLPHLSIVSLLCVGPRILYQAKVNIRTVCPGLLKQAIQCVPLFVMIHPRRPPFRSHPIEFCRTELRFLLSAKLVRRFPVRVTGVRAS